MMTPLTPNTDPSALLRVTDHVQLRHRGGQCSRPLRLAGTHLLVESGTGRIVEHVTASELPGRTLALRCRNRRASICPACSALYKLDAYHLFAAGLRGGKDTPEQVGAHPRLFITLTAPSFGKVHLGPNRRGIPRRCHPGTCGAGHPTGDPVIGTPLDLTSYDYAGQVLFNAHAGRLWAEFTTATRRSLAALARLTRKEAGSQVRLVFAKVAEFQARGVVHFHAIVRLDGPDGPHTPPPAWATIELLGKAIRAAVRKVRVGTPATRVCEARALAWGRRIDIQRITTRTADLSEQTVARYVAKYATKAAETAGVTIAPLCCRACDGHGSIPPQRETGPAALCLGCNGTGRRAGIHLDRVGEHPRTLVETTWRLGAQPALASMNLRRWAHQAGYRGHFLSKSRTYSTSFTALRAERRAFAEAQTRQRLGLDPATSLFVVKDWHYAGREGRA
ncbi:hypothetical protein BG844_36515 [Couchioplanes caeruleus subsp. caeruleus]|uniref:Replication initiation protein n=1 Tax=Couchioplanes caeruleus subsp. caeruleus TaxID=56427 RepID=A0A1K0FX25_9ACTN|nr:hypothetical protein BG844_36515 [Couchioplanes caeruleus subsp. caeruleus]